MDRTEPLSPFRKMVFLSFFSYCMVLCLSVSAQNELPDGFIRLSEVIHDIHVDLRYSSQDNFLGRPVAGYLSPVCVFSLPAAEALSKVQLDLKKEGLKLKVFDTYRPQRAVDDFVRWAKNLKDTSMKKIYYPKVSKSLLFKHGYIAARSGHTRGSTVDLTLVDSVGKELDMGTPWDFFSPKSWPSSQAVPEQAQHNRTFLRQIMQKHGFIPYEAEWWHFTLAHEPFPNTYFDFPIQ
ncbi:M15 family metallopeptidase [Cyclobacteriaceae bacterium]|nr:M15 family metallopeptidase [Cyclobacteriaceae bacterium]